VPVEQLIVEFGERAELATAVPVDLVGELRIAVGHEFSRQWSGFGRGVLLMNSPDRAQRLPD
jgi:hypothetical protein